ncbi:MAG: hypothetical protein HS115_07105 [Spirochaetales bacterium]|nr:hypothetical protein [Spirochaetales bacterium]
MTEEEAISLYLSEDGIDGKFPHISTLIAILRDARAATGRDLITGNLIDDAKAGCWLGAMGYFTVLDQIGTAVKPKGAQPEKGPSIINALRYFSNLNSSECKVLYALRCAIIHDYSLVNIPKGSNANDKELLRSFTLGADEELPLFIHPDEQWDGTFASPDQNSATFVNLLKFSDIAEDAVENAKSYASRGDLEIALKKGAQELIARYTMKIVKRKIAFRILD